MGKQSKERPHQPICSAKNAMGVKNSAMSLIGYKRKTKPALWTLVPGAAVRQLPQKPRWIRRVSKVRGAANRVYAKAAKAFLRLHRWCQCGCGRRSEQVHHRRGRAGTLLLDQRHWMAVAFICHEWIGRNPEEARRRGFLCAVGLWNVPDTR